MNEILLINTPLFREKDEPNIDDTLPPIGLGYIATYLKQNHISVKLIDAIADSLGIKEIHQVIKTDNPRFIGLNIFTTNYDIVKEIVETCELEVKFIIGGQVTKHIYNDIIKWQTDNPIDIIIGEGEYITYDIITNAVKEKPILSHTGRNVYQVNVNSQYFPTDISQIALDRSFFINEPLKNYFGEDEASIITSRGCIYNCAFCGAARSLNTNITTRERTTKSIIDEINYLKQIYPSIKYIRVLDDLFLKNVDSMEKAISIFHNTNLQWRAMAHIMSFKNVSLETLKKMRDSGCVELFMGIESGSPTILKMIHKTHDIEVIKDTVYKLLSVGINIKGYFINGFPDESEEDFKCTYNLARELKDMSIKTEGTFRVSVFQFRPYQGTELYCNLEKKFGFINQIKPDAELSNKIGRKQFNFYSENYSNCSDEILHRYIALTNKLNE